MHEDAGTYEDRAPESVWGGTKGPWWRRGPASAPRLWKYPREKGSPGAPLSTWAVGGTLAMARSDRVEAYGLATGDPLWTWQPPEGDVLAHASADAPDGVGVVLHHDHADGDETAARSTSASRGSTSARAGSCGHASSAPTHSDPSTGTRARWPSAAASS
ncbi:hypothetical protein OG478_28555 [Streptomyces phaeochromogenes]|uniref:hypothetical protein n=1 Tax=Streptomyces phaeochromogenes TaxID=1923 RepID=UPI00386A23FD|nr:hypothetical protein OG478_28555 [Streptomyces phaeochromogenes]WTA05880.1 hypothetical protein OHB08_28120 [Streptomyces phaeochromogenes]